MSFDKTRALNLARKYVARGQYRAAVSEYRALLRNDPRGTHVLVKIAELCQRMDSPHEAVEAYIEAARAYRSAGFSRRAVAAYEQAVKLAPDEAPLRVELAALCAEEHHLAAARVHYDAAITTYQRAGLVDSAIDVLEIRLALDEDDVRIRLRLAALLVDAGALDRAGEHYAEALRILRTTGAKTAFIGVASRWLSVAPNNYDLRVELATVHLGAGDAVRALELLRECYRQRPQDVEMLDVLAQTLTALGCDKRAAKVAAMRDRLVPVERASGRRLAQGSMRQSAVVAPPQPAPKRPPSEADRLYREAAAFMKLGLVAQAEPLLRRAVELDPKHRRARAALAALRRVGG